MLAKKGLALLLVLLAASAARAQEKGFSVQLPQASEAAPKLDLLFDMLLLLSSLIAGAVCALLIFFCFKYRRGAKADRTNPPTRNLPLELTWFGVPIVLSLGAFAWGAALYYQAYQPPKNALTVYVIGKQWMWKIQHTNGRREINSLHIPVGRPVRLQMISQDVIHDFYIPAFRVKQDVLPGRFTEEWFTATKPGRYHLFCAQYCGTDHSQMGGWVYAMTPSDYENWLNSGSPATSMVSDGENLFQQYGCTGCHGPASNIHAPSLVGIYNRPVPLDNKTFVTADDRYLYDSIMQPESQIAAGYGNNMPSYKGQLSEDQALQIIAYIRSLSNQPMDGMEPPQQNPANLNGRGTGTQTETARSVRQASGAGVGPGADRAEFKERRADAAARMPQNRSTGKKPSEGGTSR